MEEKDVKTYEVLAFDKSSLILKLSSKDTSSLEGLQKTRFENPEVFCKFSLNRVHYFTYSFLHYDRTQKLYSLTLNKDIFSVRRRENYRLKSSTSIPIQIRWGEEIFDCLDISTGGTSFVFDPEKRPDIQKGTLLEDIVLVLCGQTYSIPRASIVNTWPRPPEEEENLETDKHCAGVSFIDLPEGTQESLFVQVNAEAREGVIQKKSSPKSHD